MAARFDVPLYAGGSGYGEQVGEEVVAVSSQSDSERYAREAQDLRRKVAGQSSIVARARKDEAAARSAASRATSPSTLKSKLSEAERHADKANKAEQARADLEGKAASKEKQMYEARAKADKERLAAAEKSRKQQADSLKQMEQRLARQYTQASAASLITRREESVRQSQSRGTADDRDYDLFISHASEDKADIARPLYEALTQRGLTVWFDEAALTLGDSLRRKIDEGLAHSRYGVVILSHDFFAKQWPQAELDGLFTRQVSEDRKVILPIWHKISKDEVLGYSPTLGGTLAAQTALQTVQEIADELYRVARPS